MIAALILGTYAVAGALAGPALLKRWWPGGRTPRLTIALVLATACSFLIAATTASLALAITLIDQLARINPKIDGCADRLPINDESTLGPILSDLGLAVSAALATRIGYCLIATFAGVHLRRRSHAQVLRLCTRADERLGVLVLDHEDPACYCLPGRNGTVVITSGALRRLTEEQTGAVLHHERAHLRGRHHLLIAFAFAVRRTIPRVRLLEYAEQETRHMIELIADDAARQSGASTVAAALAVIGGGQVPGAALGIAPADGPSAVARVMRLVGSEGGLSRRGVILSSLGATAVIALPILLGMLSVATAIRHCPPSTDDETPQSTGTPWTISTTR